MLGFSEEAQGCLPCKITTVMDDKWQIEWWGTALKVMRLRTKQSSTTLKKQDGGTGSQRKHWRENVITIRTRTGHKGSGVRRTNGKCQSGEVNEKMRGVRSVRRKEDPSMRDNFPKEEGK
jgi:hypothetical protein